MLKHVTPLATHWLFSSRSFHILISVTMVLSMHFSINVLKKTDHLKTQNR